MSSRRGGYGYSGYGGSGSGRSSGYSGYGSGSGRSNNYSGGYGSGSGRSGNNSSHGFTYDGEGYAEVYTDGACINNGRQGAQAGKGVWFGHNHPMNMSEPVYGRQTNNTAEIQAATDAINAAKSSGVTRVNVKTDSQFTVDCSEKWMGNWKNNGWKTSSGGDVKNRADLERLDSAMDGMDVKWTRVDAHQGIEGNEAADRLANEGARRY